MDMSIINEDGSSFGSDDQLNDIETGTSTSTYDALNDKQNEDNKIQLAKRETEASFAFVYLSSWSFLWHRLLFQ